MPDHAFTVGSLFTGVGGFDLGLERAGGKVLFQCEADAYRRRVLNRHWPDVPVYPDVCALRGEELPHVDLLCGGFPCQDVSVAGQRAGLAGGRSGLFFEFARLADELVRPGGWVLIENVPGLLSSHGGRDFAVLLATLAELGFHDCAWRVLDSRFFGVPQRRRRVYILARRARGRRSFEVLLESDSVRGDLETSWEARARAAGASRGGAEGGRVAAPLTKGSAAGPGVSVPGRRQEDDTNIVVSHTLTGEGFDASEDGTGRGTPLVASGLTARYGRGPDSDATDTLIAPAVTAKWAKGSGGPAGDECQNLVDDRTIANGDITRSLTARNGSHGRAGVDLEDAESNWIVPDISPPLLSNPAGGGGQRTTDVDTAVYAVGPEPVRAVAVRTNQTGANGGNVYDNECPTLDNGTPPAVLAGDVREASRGEHGGRPRDVGAERGGADAELDGAGGDERGAGGGVRRPESNDGRGDAPHAEGGGEQVVGCGADPDARGTPVDADGVREAPGVPGRVDDREVAAFRSSGRGYFDEADDAATLAASPRTAHEDNLVAEGFDHLNLESTGEVTHTLRAGEGAGNTMPMAYNVQPVSTREERDALTAAETDTAGARTASDGKRSERGTLILENGDEVCEGSPFDPKPDGPRYAAMGDAVTVNVIEWIGVRLREAAA